MDPIRDIPSGHQTVELPFDGSIVYLDRWPRGPSERTVMRQLRRTLDRQKRKAVVAVPKNDPNGARLYYLDKNSEQHLYLLRSPIIGHASLPAGAGYALVVPSSAANRLAAELRFYTHLDQAPDNPCH